MAGKVTVQVCDGWLVYDGVEQRGGGERVDLDPATAERFVAAGWVVPVEPVKAKRKRS